MAEVHDMYTEISEIGASQVSKAGFWDANTDVLRGFEAEHTDQKSSLAMSRTSVVVEVEGCPY